MFVDTHIHLGDDALFFDREQIYHRALAAQVIAMVDICTDDTTLQRGRVLQEQYAQIFLAASATPHDEVEAADAFFVTVEEAAHKGWLVAIGEIGLDYHYEHVSKKTQKERLERYFQLAKEVNLPVIFHCREAFSDLFLIANHAYAQGKALIHCFTGSQHEAKQALDCGWYISFSGIITFTKSELLRQVLQYVPLDRILLETDGPYLAPKSRRGRVNESSFLPEIAATVAEVKGITLEQVAQQTTDNAKTFFSL